MSIENPEQQALQHWDRIYATSEYSKELPPDRLPVMERAVQHFGALEGKRLLDIGCGAGATALFFAAHGAEVTAIDTSEVAIEHLRERIAREGIPNVKPVLANAFDIEQLGPFDCVFGSMILHHLEPFPEFSATLKAAMADEGRAFFWENNAASRLLVWCREKIVGKFWIPKHGDADEFPLTPQEIDELRTKFGVKVEFPELFFFRLISVYIFRRRLMSLFKAIDDAFYKRNLLRRYSYRQYVMLEKTTSGLSTA